MALSIDGNGHTRLLQAGGDLLWGVLLCPGGKQKVEGLLVVHPAISIGKAGIALPFRNDQWPDTACGHSVSFPTAMVTQRSSPWQR